MTHDAPGGERVRDDGTTFVVPTPPPGASVVFGARLPLAVAYVERLADSGVSHGLIGPREVPRLWDRHVLNSAVVAELVPQDATVIDVGSGAGLPGIPLAIARPDLRVSLVEPLLRRTTWLAATIAELGLDNVEVQRGKAEAFHGKRRAAVVTARAVSRLSNLGPWCAPLVRPDGLLLALKGSSAVDELAEDSTRLAEVGLVDGEIVSVGGAVLAEPTTVVRLRRSATADVPARTGRDRVPSGAAATTRRGHGGGRRRGR